MIQFQVHGRSLALPSGMVCEILRPQLLTPVPHAPRSVLGVANLRGTVLPVLCAARLSGEDTAARTSATRILVVQASFGANNATFGLLVDQVTGLAAPGEGTELFDLAAFLALQFKSHAPTAQVQTATAAAPARAAPERAAHESMVVFTVAGQEYAMRLAEVAEITRLPEHIVALPGTDAAMLGATSHRGTTLPLVSLRVLLGLPPSHPAGAQPRVLVVNLGGALMGLSVDTTRSTLRVAADAIDPVPPVLLRGQGEARIAGIIRAEGRLISLLAAASLFASETAARLLAHAAPAQLPSAPVDRGRDEFFVVFSLGDESYGVPAGVVEQVVARPPVFTPVPRAPDFLLGVMNLRGQALPVIDQRRRFGAAEAALGRSVLVLRIGGVRLGLLVHEVRSLLRIAAAELQPLPELTAADVRLFDRAATVERAGTMILLIDPACLLHTCLSEVIPSLAA